MRIALVAGESSGDQLGAGLIRALKAARPSPESPLEFEGIAGAAMQQEGCLALEDSEALAVMGLIEPLKEVPRLIALRRSLVKRWRADPPTLFVGIDAPDFNLGLEIALKDAGIPTIHYVSPTVWAWRQRRVHKIARAADRVLCLFPFEKEFYDRHGIAADFVGHPLADRLATGLTRTAVRQALGIESECVVAVLPGSRRNEVSRLGPVFAATARRIAERRPDVTFVTPLANETLRAPFAAQLEEEGIKGRFRLLERDAQSAIAAADIVLLASGTATLETALLCRPMVVAYRVSPLSYVLARSLRLLKVRHFALPNFLTPTPLVPEFLQGAATPEALSSSLLELLEDAGRRAGIEDEFAKLRERLARGADSRAAGAVLDLAAHPRDAQPNDASDRQG